MSKPNVLITLRQDKIDGYNEVRDAIDCQWYDFLAAAELTPVLVPNHIATVQKIIENRDFSGVILSGGGEHLACGTDVRSAIETLLYEYCVQHNLPLLGVCRGMQVVQLKSGEVITSVSGHVVAKQLIDTLNGPRHVNSYHRYGCYDSGTDFHVWAKSYDGVVKAITHKLFPVKGIMWHPERMSPFAEEDILLFKEHFSSTS